MPSLTDEDKVIRNDVGKRIAAAIESLSAPEAEKVSYDNTESGMTADNTQDAIDELKSDIDSVELTDLDDVNLTSPQDEDELHYDSSTSKWKNIAKKIYEKSASGSLVSFNDGGDNIPLKSLIANITAVQSCSGTPSPSNIRAISGWSEINVSRTGKNLLSINSSTISQASYVLNNVPIILPAGNYVLSFNFTGTGNSSSLRIDDADGNQIFTASKTISSGANQISISLSQVGYAIKFYSNAIGSYTNIQLEVGTSATTFEPYNGTQIALPFGQTVYGGTLDVLSGVLTVNKGFVTLVGSTEATYSPNGTTATTSNAIVTISGKANGINNFITSKFEVGSQALYGVTGRANSGNIEFYLPTNVAQTADAIKAWFANNNTQVCYELATPIVIQLTPSQISTLLGQNNIFADTGDISLSYFTQNANAINDIAESNTRTALNTDVPKTDLTDIFVTGAKNNTGSTIFNGTYFYVNGQLALCRSSISANADLTLNTNYELVTAGALNKLMSTLSYSTTETPVGKWTDGKTIYRKVTTGLSLTTTANAWCDTGISSTNAPTIISGRVIDTSGQVFPCAVGRLNNNFAISIPLTRSNISTLILEYIKS